jgi:NDP-sugar pyrophosphorylase family protein
MVKIAGRPFLEHLLDFLRNRGVRRVVLCVGHGADAIQGHFGSGAKYGLELRYSVEHDLLGTGGAIKLGVRKGEAETFLVLNGDSFLDVDLDGLLRYHHQAAAQVTVSLAAVEDTSRFGAVAVEQASGMVREFGEKRHTGPGVINAGIYLVERDVAEGIPAGVVSFERDVLPKLIGHGLYGFVTQGFFVDIGVPEDYQRLADHPNALLAAAGVRSPTA